jgi:hypothetical protein
MPTRTLNSTYLCILVLVIPIAVSLPAEYNFYLS